MRVILKAGLLILSTEDAAEQEALAAWCGAMKDHVFRLDGGTAKGAALHDLGPRPEACREPINIVFAQTEARWRPISNLARTPFTLRGRSYASIEGFWQGLKFESDAERARVAALWGRPAKAASTKAETERFTYDGEIHAVGGPGHHSLMLEACRAKFSQHQGARDALLATGERPLTHRMRRDSTTIPGALMADIWMRVRADLRQDS